MRKSYLLTLFALSTSPLFAMDTPKLMKSIHTSPERAGAVVDTIKRILKSKNQEDLMVFMNQPEDYFANLNFERIPSKDLSLEDFNDFIRLIGQHKIDVPQYIIRALYGIFHQIRNGRDYHSCWNSVQFFVENLKDVDNPGEPYFLEQMCLFCLNQYQHVPTSFRKALTYPLMKYVDTQKLKRELYLHFSKWNPGCSKQEALATIKAALTTRNLMESYNLLSQHIYYNIYIQGIKPIDFISNIVKKASDIKSYNFENQNLIKRIINLKEPFTEDVLDRINVQLRKKAWPPEESEKLRSLIEAKLLEQFPAFYKDNLEQFSRVKFTDIPGIPLEEENKIFYKTPDEDPLGKTIYNLQGYDEGVKDIEKKDQIFEGHPLFLAAGEQIKDTSLENPIINPENIPIGYNIHLPKGPLKALFVTAYGGLEVSDRIKHLCKPTDKSSLYSALLSNGIGVITLNLLDLLKLKVFQAKMPEDIHTYLHASIHKFYTTLRENPAALSADFVLPKDIKIYLYGASFGGRTAIRQAELYPETFDGYISHDGAIGSNTKNEYPPHLSVMTKNVNVRDCDPKINLIRKPILLLHNYDDNTVSIQDSIDFYKEFRKCHMNDPLLSRFPQLLITSRGNPKPPSRKNPDMSGNPFTYKGHFNPIEEEAFQNYTQTLIDFILKGPNSFQQTDEWMAFQYELYNHKNNQEASVQKQFLSEAFRLYKTTAVERYKGKKGTSWEELFEKDWDDFYKNLFYLIYYLNELNMDPLVNDEALKMEIDFIQGQNPSDEVLLKAIQIHLPLFINYLQERYHFRQISREKFMASANELIAPFRDLLLEKGSYLDHKVPFDTSNAIKARFKTFLLYSYYRGNPDLFQKRWPEILQSMDQEELQEALSHAKIKLKRRLEKDDQLADESSWEQVLR